MRARTSWKVGSLRQLGTLHQLVLLVRTGVTPSPARLRWKSCPATRSRWSASPALRKESKPRTHGSRCSTRGLNCGNLSIASVNMASTSPLRTPGGIFGSLLHASLYSMPHISHEKVHCFSMNCELLSHSPAAAHAAHSSRESWHAADSHSAQLARQERRMNDGLFAHSPCLAHSSHAACSSAHAAYLASAAFLASRSCASLRSSDPSHSPQL
mmetsp:Transcript_21377/g.53319  ORF Transcript_21377/g.53319 Transcript_21377/m.53319 type:complete len:213 (-) Transcript_21377:180-818(-)